MTIDELPTFTVHRVDNGRAIGVFETPRWMGEHYLAKLIAPPLRFVDGQFVDVELATGTATFVPSTPHEIEALRAGQSYHRLDAYWGRCAELVLDRERHWEERVFEPMDAVQFQQPNGFILGPAIGASPPEASVVPGGWDHEHREICMATISPHGQPVGMFSEPKHWLCLDCHQKFVVPRSLDFIGEGK